MLNIGIIGCGKIAQVRHIPEYLQNPEAKLCAFFDLNFERAKALADQYGGTAYKSLDKMFAGEKLNAVSICSANNSHAEHALAAMEHGVNVLLEKPMAVTLEECIALTEKAKEKGVKLMIDQNQRLAKAHAKAHELIAAGAIGKVLSFRTVFGHGGPETWSIDPGSATWFFDKSRASMGAMGDLGVHKTDLIQYLIGSNIKAVSAKLATVDKRLSDGSLITVDDNALCIYEMENGAVGTMSASWTYYGAEDNSTVVYGDKGIMRIYDDPSYSLKIIGRDGSVITYELDRIQTNDNQTSSGIIDAFVQCLNEGTTPLIDAVSVLPAMRAVFAAMQSSSEGRRIEIA